MALDEAAKAAERRRRHRESMARGRSRLSQSMAQMRREHAALLLTQRALLSARSKAPNSGDKKSLVAEFAAVAEQQNALLEEREALVRRMEQLEIFEAAVRVDAPVFRSQDDDLKQQGEQLIKDKELLLDGRRGRLVYFTQEEPPFYYEPVSEQTCRSWIRDAYQSGKRHHARFARRKSIVAGADAPGEAYCFGWRVQRSLVDSHLHFHFSKRFPTCDPEALAERLMCHGWDVLNDPNKYVKLYRTVLIVKVLQRVDTFNSIILRNSPSPDRSVQIRTVTVMSRVDDVDEFGRRTLTIVNLVTDPREDLAPPVLQEANKNKIKFIRDACTYIMLTVGYGHEGADGDAMKADGSPIEPYVEMTYGGHGDCLNEHQAQYLFVETGHVLFRFEQVLCPRNLVTSS